MSKRQPLRRSIVDYQYDVESPTNGLGDPRDGNPLVAWGDTSVTRLNLSASKKSLQAAFAVVAALLLSVNQTTNQNLDVWDRALNLALLAAGLFLLWLAATSQWVERRLNRIISWALRRWVKLEVRDYLAVLHLQGGFAVSELKVAPGDWLCDKTLVDLRLPNEGVLVLGVQRPGQPYQGTPNGATRIAESDTLILYGRVEQIEELDQRRRGWKGDAAHQEAVEGHKSEKSQT